MMKCRGMGALLPEKMPSSKKSIPDNIPALGMAAGGKVATGRSRIDGCAQKGHTLGKMT